MSASNSGAIPGSSPAGIGVAIAMLRGGIVTGTTGAIAKRLGAVSKSVSANPGHAIAMTATGMTGAGGIATGTVTTTIGGIMTATTTITMITITTTGADDSNLRLS